MLPPSSLVLSQGWGLIDLPLRAFNEGSPRPRVARAQKIIRLHPASVGAHGKEHSVAGTGRLLGKGWKRCVKPGAPGPLLHGALVALMMAGPRSLSE